MEKLQPTSQIEQLDPPSITDTSFPELASPSDSGDVKGREEERGEHGKKGNYTNPLGIPKGPRKTSESIYGRDKPSDALTRALDDEPSLRNQKDSEADMLDEKTKAQIGKSIETTMEEILAKKKVPARE